MSENNNENEFTHTDGVVYVAVDAPSGWCNGCFFDMNRCVYSSNPCTARNRKDKRRIIWKPKERQDETKNKNA